MCFALNCSRLCHASHRFPHCYLETHVGNRPFCKACPSGVLNMVALLHITVVHVPFSDPWLGGQEREIDPLPYQGLSVTESS